MPARPTRSFRPARLLTGALATYAVLLAAAGPTSAASGRNDGMAYWIDIKDHVALPGESQPDSVGLGYASNSYPSDSIDSHAYLWPQVERAGVSIVSNPGHLGRVQLADLQDGDVVVLRSAAAGSPVLERYTYRRLPRLDGPVCAGATTYSGVRPDGVSGVSGTAVQWGAGYPVLPPIDQNGYPQALPQWWIPGAYPGYGTKGAIWAPGTLSGPNRFTLKPEKALAVGMHFYVSTWIVIPSFTVSVEIDQPVIDCAGSMPTPTATPLPSSTEAPQAQPTSNPKPAGDRTPPKGTLTGTTSKVLRKLGRGKLLRGGLPVTVTSDEAARLVGTLTLVGGKKPFASTVSINVIKGVSITHVPLSKTMVKQITKAKHPRLRLEGALVDGAGNRLPLPAIAVTVPGR